MANERVKAKDLRAGDEVQVTVVGGQELLTVREAPVVEGEKVKVTMEWGFHIPIAEPVVDYLDPDFLLTVQR